ncbi:TrbC family F-type conjugative pilus assembly protein [Caminibacter sp.]
MNAYAFDMNSYLQQLKKKSEESAKKYYSKKEGYILKKREENVNYNASLNLYRKYFSNDTYTIENYPKTLNTKYLFKRRMVLFYLFTTNMPKETYLNVFKQAEIIKDKLPVIGVLRGMDLSTKRRLDNAFKNVKVYFNGRVNPFIFRDLGIKKAPVFIVANCQVKPYLKYKSCKFLYRFDGDVTLSYALSKIGDYDDKIKRISFDFYK